MNRRLRVNDQIKVSQVRVVFNDGSQEVMPTYTAMSKAKEQSLDLIEVQPNAHPPICKLVDYGKYLYEQGKRDKKSRKKQKHISVKEIRFHPNIDEHDFEFKASHAISFLVKGGKVRVTTIFMGRQIIYKERGYKLMDKMAERLSIVGKIESPAKLEGKHLYAFFVPDRNKVNTYLKKKKESSSLDSPTLKGRDKSPEMKSITNSSNNS